MPLAGEHLRASLAARYVGSSLITPGAHSDGYAVADFTLTSRDFLPGVSITGAVRNVFDHRYEEVSSVESDGSVSLFEYGERSLWLSLEYAFQ